MSKTGLSPHPHPQVVSRQFLCCSSYLFLCLCFHMQCLFCPYLFLISPSLGALGGLCIVIVVFHLYFCRYFRHGLKVCM